MSVNDVTSQLKPYPMEELTRIKKSLAANGQPIFDFGTGDPKIPLWPKINECLKLALTEVTQYPSIRGTDFLQEAHQNYLLERFDLDLKDDLMSLPTRGSKEAVFHIALSMVGRNGRKTIVYPTPGYPVYKSSTLFAGGKPYPVPLKEDNGYLFEPWNLPLEVQKDCAAIWVNYPHNPTGACVDDEYWKKLCDWCEENDSVLLSDDCYVDIFSSHLEEDKSQQPKMPLQFKRKNVLSLLSLSKRSGLTGYRCGMIVGDKEILEAHVRARANMGLGQPQFLQEVASLCWKDQRHVATRRKIFSERMDLLVPSLKSLGLVDSTPGATFYIWAKVPEKFENDISFAKSLAEKGVIVTPGQWLGSSESSYFRMALVPDEKETQKAVEIISDSLN